ncbi:hypothetical protein ACS3SW_11735 [Roseobacteraceae bacterium S113]
MEFTLTQNYDTPSNVVSSGMFGTNILTDTNESDGIINQAFWDAVELVGASHLRYPAGRAEIQDITHLDTAATGTDRLSAALRSFLDEIKERGMETTLVVPSIATEDTDAAMLREWVGLLEQYMGDDTNLIKAFEVGNEYWGLVDESVYGANAFAISTALREASTDAFSPEIWIQTANIVGGQSAYKGSNQGTISNTDAIAAMGYWEDDARPFDWQEGETSAQYFNSLTAFEQRIIQANLEVLQFFDADQNITNGFQEGADGATFNAIVAHYYYDKYFDGWDLTPYHTRVQNKYLDLRLSPWEAMVPTELDVQITEWNVESDHYNDLGLRAAGTLIEQFENMLSLGADGADFWALRHNTTSAVAGNSFSDAPVTLDPAGLALSLLHDSLSQTNGVPMQTIEIDGFDPNVINVTGFASRAKTVIYVSSRDAIFNMEVSLDLSQWGSGNDTWSARHVGMDRSTSDGLSENRAYDEDGNLVARVARRQIDEDELAALQEVLGDARDDSLVKEVNGVLRTYLPEPDDILLLPGIENPTSLADFYFATETDVAGLMTFLDQSELGSTLDDVSFELDPYELIEITIEHADGGGGGGGTPNVMDTPFEGPDVSDPGDPEEAPLPDLYDPNEHFVFSFDGDDTEHFEEEDRPASILTDTFGVSVSRGPSVVEHPNENTSDTPEAFTLSTYTDGGWF